MSEAPTTEQAPRGWRRWVNANMLGLAFLLAAIGISVFRVSTIQKDLFNPNEIVIRIAHWQLELGFREALQNVIDEYNALHRDNHVRVIQMPVTEKVYSQWLNTHLISGTAPDLVELGKSRMASSDEYVVRFFLPLTEVIEDPNPYNEGTILEHLPWKESLLDGMRGGYRENLQDYYAVPTVFWNLRLSYNRQLLKEATGSDAPPTTLGELLEACDAIRRLGEARGEKLIPIAGSRYSREYFLTALNTPFFSHYEPLLDLNLDGSVDPVETFSGFARGDVSFQDERVKAYFDAVLATCKQFSEGFMAMERDQAAFLFVQGQAGFISTGSWDARSLREQADFDMGIIDCPLPGPGERWHELISARANEAQKAGGAPFAVYKFAKHPEWAIDFLRYLSSRRVNETFNREADWLPVVIGAEPSEHMKPFMPQPKGFAAGSRLFFKSAGRLSTLFFGQLWLYMQQEISYEEFTEAVEAALEDPYQGIDRVWAGRYDSRKRQARGQERLLALHSTRALLEPDAVDARAKFRLALTQQVLLNNGEETRHRFETETGRPIPEI